MSIGVVFLNLFLNLRRPFLNLFVGSCEHSVIIFHPKIKKMKIFSKLSGEICKIAIQMAPTLFKPRLSFKLRNQLAHQTCK